MNSSEVARIDVFPVLVPRKDVFALQRGDSDNNSWFSLVKITTSDGTHGWGECVTRVRSMHRVVGDHLHDRLIGHDAFDIHGFHRIVDREEMLAIERLWHWNPIRAALEMALFDIQGKITGRSVAELLGGIQRREIETVKNVGVGTPEKSAELARTFVDAGYRLLKVRVGTDAAIDEGRIAAIRSVVDDSVRIRLDANQAWTPNEALARIRAVAHLGIEAVEQPCAFWDVAANAAVTAQSPVPIIADEGFVSVPEAQVLLAARGADILHAYIGKCGGIQPTMEIAALARSFGAAMTIGERVPLGVSEAAHLQVAAALPDLDHPCALAYDLNEDDLLVTRPDRSAGVIHVPEGPGLGVDVDPVRLEKYARAM
jgi:L-alanine-DL-glutamate epimerase-like enolase superfamily enzyme